jgi:hypothetical protein
VDGAILLIQLNSKLDEEDDDDGAAGLMMFLVEATVTTDRKAQP